MLGLTDIHINTEQIAYPLDAEYYPLIRVFEAPYTVGDCPVDEAVLNEHVPDEDYPYWYLSEGEATTRAEINLHGVTINALQDNDYTIDQEYEVRIYASDELVPHTADE